MDASQTQVRVGTSQSMTARRVLPRHLLSPFVVLFLLGLVVPSIIEMGTLRLSVYRVMLLLMTVPCGIMWLAGLAGKKRFADLWIILFWLWTTFSYSVTEGFSKMIEANGIFFLETVGTYLLARCFIRTADDFRAMVSVLYWIVMIMLPFAVYETLTGKAVMLDFFDWFSEIPNRIEKEPRLGLYRVQGTFDHQILFGVFCGSILAMVHLVLGYQQNPVRRNMRTGLVFFTAFLSLSSGPMAAQMAQAMLLGWNWLMRAVHKKWKVLTGMVLSLVVFIELFANRTTPELFISYFALNPGTAWNRLRIWDYGTMNVANHPLFGLGTGEWVRAPGMTSSVDMFWLVPAIRNGIPAALFLALAFAAILYATLSRRELDDRTEAYRTGYVISIVGIIMAGWTVHYWNATYVLVIFLLGSGAWFGEQGLPPLPRKDRPRKQRRETLPYSRSARE